MKLIAKNFSTDQYKIREHRNGIFLNIHFYKVEGDRLVFDNFFFKVVMPGKAKEARIELLKRVEKHYGISLLRPEFNLHQLN